MQYDITIFYISYFAIIQNNHHSNDNIVTRVVVPDLTYSLKQSFKSISATRYKSYYTAYIYKLAFESCCETFALSSSINNKKKRKNRLIYCSSYYFFFIYYVLQFKLSKKKLSVISYIHLSPCKFILIKIG